MDILPGDSFSEYSAAEWILEAPISIKKCFLEGEKLEDGSYFWKVEVTKFLFFSCFYRLFKRLFYKSKFISGGTLQTLFLDSMTSLLRKEPPRDSHPLTNNRYFQYFAKNNLKLTPDIITLYLQALKQFLALTNGLTCPAECLVLDKEFCSELLAYSHISKAPPYYPNDPDFSEEYKREQKIRYTDYSLSDVIHLDETERTKYEVSFSKGGSLIQNEKILCTSKINPYSPKETSPSFMPIYTIDTKGKLYISPRSIFKFNHSSFLAGGPSLSAGELQTNDKGELITINSHSGHYKPSIKHFLAALKYFEENGCRLEGVFLIESFGEELCRVFNSAKAYLEQKGELPEDGYSYNKLIGRYIYSNEGEISSLKISLSTFTHMEEILHFCQTIAQKLSNRGKLGLKELQIVDEDQNSFICPLQEFLETRGRAYQAARVQYIREKIKKNT